MNINLKIIYRKSSKYLEYYYLYKLILRKKMKKIFYSLTALIIAISLSGCAGNQLTEDEILKVKKECKNSFLYADGECLEYYLSKGSKQDKVIVFLPGSHTKGGHALSWATEHADDIASVTNINTYIINMPGYGMSSTNRFNKMLWNPGNIPTADINFINFTIKVLEEIKKKNNAKNLYVIGHSSGAALASIISGYKPNLIQKAICIGGTYDFDTRVKNWKKWSKYSYVSAIDYVENITNTDIILLIGEDEKEARLLQTKIFEKALLKNNKKVKVVSYPNVSHNMSDEMWNDISSYIKE